MEDQYRVVGEFQKAADLITRVRVVEIDNVKVIEFRDWIPSLGDEGDYGRGYWIPLTEEAVFGVMDALKVVSNTEAMTK